MSHHLDLCNSQSATAIGFAWDLLHLLKIVLGLPANKMLLKITELCEA